MVFTVVFTVVVSTVEVSTEVVFAGGDDWVWASNVFEFLYIIYCFSDFNKI